MSTHFALCHRKEFCARLAFLEALCRLEANAQSDALKTALANYSRALDAYLTQRISQTRDSETLEHFLGSLTGGAISVGPGTILSNFPTVQEELAQLVNVAVGQIVCQRCSQGSPVCAGVEYDDELVSSRGVRLSFRLNETKRDPVKTRRFISILNAGLPGDQSLRSTPERELLGADIARSFREYLQVDDVDRLVTRIAGLKARNR